MHDGQDDLDIGSGTPSAPEQPQDVHDWLDAAIRATVDATHGRRSAPPTAPEESPEAGEPDSGPDDAAPARFSPAAAIRTAADRPRPEAPRPEPFRSEPSRSELPRSEPLRSEPARHTPPLRYRLDPIWVPAPEEPSLRQRLLPLLRYGPVIAGAAAAAYGIAVWGSPTTMRKIVVADARPIVVDAQTEAQVAPHLIVHDQHVLTNEPMPLDVSVDRSVSNASLRVAGLAAGTHLSAGSPLGDTGWTVPMNGLKNLFMYAPTDFVGTMNSAVDLRGADQKLIDQRQVKLEWVEPKKPMSLVPPPKPAANPPPAPAPVPVMSAEVAASLLQRGQDYLKNGDIASARIVFTRLAAAGIADGAFAAGETYDSAYLAEHSVFGVSGDEAKARAFYQRAAKLGSTEAAARLAGAVPK